MSGLPAASRRKLAKLLGLLGSDHRGERDAAGLAAHRLVKQAGVRRSDLPHLSPINRGRPPVAPVETTHPREIAQ